MKRIITCGDCEFFLDKSVNSSVASYNKNLYMCKKSDKEIEDLNFIPVWCKLKQKKETSKI